MEMQRPLLSIGIIFKNEIRCLERCLNSLQPLRDAVSNELVMADTGSDDGSRQVAEQYADTLIDFPWINDFSAARNAVMNQCSGKWYLSIDCDEWLDGDLSGLIYFLKTDRRLHYGAVVVRNYSSAGLEKDGEYNDFDACRLLRMSTGLRYEGAIHEHWPTYHGKQDIKLFPTVIFHHDGYMFADPVFTRQKRDRNMELLEKKLEENPEDLTALMQCIESADGRPELLDYIKRGVQGVKEKRRGWDMLGGPILRYAVVFYFRGGLPELQEHIQLAEEMFPDSIFTRIDVTFIAFGECWRNGDYKECIRLGERYLAAHAQFMSGEYNHIDTMCSTLLLSSRSWKTQLQLFLAGSYLYEGQPEKGLAILTELDGTQMTVNNVSNAAQIWAHFHARTTLDTAPIVRCLWEQITSPVPDEERGVQRCNELIRVSAGFFEPHYQEEEAGREDFHRHAYTMFLPIAGDCVLGDAAAILDEEDPQVLELMLSKIEAWDALPICALSHALAQGVAFPLPDKPMKMEELDILAGRLSQNAEYLHPLIARLAEENPQRNMQALVWARGLALAAICTGNWQDKSQTERNMTTVRTFARVEGAFLPRCYAAEALTEDNIDILPPMHRFGWYCARAFAALDSGNTTDYVHLLHAGLETYKDMKTMVEFLIDNTPELQTPPPSAELLSLSEQVRTVLARFSPDDPMIVALKQSEAYQKVAHLIDSIEAPVIGGLAQ